MDPRLRGDDDKRRPQACATRSHPPRRHCERSDAIQLFAPLQHRTGSLRRYAPRDDKAGAGDIRYRRISPIILNRSQVAIEQAIASIVASSVPPAPFSNGMPPVFIPKKPVTSVAGMISAVITDRR